MDGVNKIHATSKAFILFSSVNNVLHIYASARLVSTRTLGDGGNDFAQYSLNPTPFGQQEKQSLQINPTFILHLQIQQLGIQDTPILDLCFYTITDRLMKYQFNGHTCGTRSMWSRCNVPP